LNPINPRWEAHKRAARVEGTVIQKTLGVVPEREGVPRNSPNGYMDVNSSNGKARIYYKNNNVIGVSYFK